MTAADVDAYLRELDEPRRVTLQRVRERILLVVPDVEECISYAVPGFRLRGAMVAGLAAFTTHLSYLPHSGSVLSALTDELTAYTRTKSALHFAVGEPLPQAVVERLLDTRLRQAGLR